MVMVVAVCCFIASAHFHGVNTPIMADFEASVNAELGRSTHTKSSCELVLMEL